ncbi:MAG: class I SAM-dependent methyltransferase [Epulopiscium sp.]|nr:class I SAM-dependent methyltransferase [Candidatus Epulonipiscium sp.]
MRKRYKLISKLHCMIDIFYFYNQDRSPRKSMICSLPKGEIKVFDMCTGIATNAIFVAKSNPQATVIGVDVSRDMLRIAQRRIDKEHLGNVQLHRMDATKTSYESESFDVVIISFVLHELNDKYATKIVKEAKRIVKQEGVIVVIEWERPKKILQKIKFRILHLFEPEEFREFIMYDLQQYLSNHGLQIKKRIHCDYSQVLLLHK